MQSPLKRSSELKARNPHILEGKSAEAVYASAAAEWAYVYMIL